MKNSIRSIIASLAALAVIAFTSPLQAFEPDTNDRLQLDVKRAIIDIKRADPGIESFFENEAWMHSFQDISLLAHLDIGRFLTHPETWIGIVVCGLLTTAAIYVRRFRDES